MKQKRAERIMEALKEMGLRQMLIVDPMSMSPDSRSGNPRIHPARCPFTISQACMWSHLNGFMPFT